MDTGSHGEGREPVPVWVKGTVCCEGERAVLMSKAQGEAG